MSKNWEIRYLRHVERETGKSLSAIAKEAGVASTTLTRPVNNPDHKFSVKQATLEAVERVTGIPFDGFRTGNNTSPERFEVGDATPENIELIPVYDVAASAGHGAVAEYEAQTHSLAFPPDYLKRLTSSSPGNLSIISVKGESMEPTLLDDDIVLLDTSKTNLSYDGLFVLRFDDALHVKRIGRSPKKRHITIISDNRNLYPPMEATISDVQAIGKVLWYGRKV
jgi:phage repressor protein C with HTH and peptisase S24 domain